jgi:hypothetical protein
MVIALSDPQFLPLPKLNSSCGDSSAETSEPRRYHATVGTLKVFFEVVFLSPRPFFIVSDVRTGNLRKARKGSAKLLGLDRKAKSR